jgi:PEP-CTERM motif-containing protein
MEARLRLILVMLSFIGMALVLADHASALTITFLEPGNDSLPIVPTTDLPGATITPGVESASVTLGTVTASTAIVAQVALVQTQAGTMEGGGQGVSDIVTLLNFLNPAGTPVGFRATFQSDTSTTEKGLPTPTTLTLLDIEETGFAQVAISGRFVVGGLNGNIATDVTINALSDRDVVPEPSTLLLVGAGLVGVNGALWRRGGRR